MRGGDVRRIRTGRESTFAGGLNSSLAGSWLEERMPGKRMPRGSEKNFLQMSWLAGCWQWFLKIPAKGLFAY